MYVCVWMDVWEKVIWCMGVGVKADRMRIVIIFVPSTVTNIILTMFMISVLSVCCCALLNFELFIQGHFLSFFF